jgi:hypothetical protein
MKKQSFIQTLIIAAILVFASCKKENTTETQSVDAKIEEASNVPEKDTYTKNDIAEDSSFTSLKMENKESLISPKRAKNGLLETRSTPVPVNNETKSTQADFSLVNLSCGSRVSSTTVGRANYYSDYFYGRLGFDSHLNGGDKIYYFTLTQEQIVNFYLTNTHRNLAMMLFKGHYVWQNGVIIERFDDVEAWSESTSTTDERLANLRLTPGKYMLIIDSAPNAGSSFTLSVNCMPVSTSCNTTPGYGLFYDKFEHYRLGNINTQSPNWNKWTGSTYDCEVASNGSQKYLKVDYKEGASDYNQPNCDLELGQRNSGNYQLEFDMWVNSNNTASFYTQKVINSDVGAYIYIDKSGQGRVITEGRAIAYFSFPNNKWAKVRLDVNLSNNTTRLYIDGILKASWACTNSLENLLLSRKTFRGLRFFAKPYGLYFVNNVCFIQRF